MKTPSSEDLVFRRCDAIAFDRDGERFIGNAGVIRRRNDDPDDDRTNFDYVIGRGQGRIRAETFSGTVHISQGQP